MLYRNFYKSCILFILIITTLTSCKKFTEIDPPINSLNPAQTFGDNLSAEAAINGIYTTMTSSPVISENITAYLALSADELIKNNPEDESSQLMNNSLSVNNSKTSSLWSGFYQVIGQANACLDGLQSSTGVTAANKTKFTGEAKFMRAFCYFYLVNLYGDVPLLVTNNWTQTSTTSRSPQAQVYQQIIQDLQDAQNTLPTTNPSGAVTRATKWAATALLARVYLYQQNWKDAETQATDVISSAEFNMPLPNLSDVFLIGSTEAIFQLVPVSYYKNPLDYTNFYNFGSVGYFVTDTLFNSFEAGDQRKTEWLQSQMPSGQTVYIPYKYKGDAYSGDPVEYYMMLRLAEQYLIRAEARANQNNIAGAVDDLNVIRRRAGLPDLLATLTQAQAIAAVEKERQVELFAEWGHRWFDLKRLPGATSGKTRADEVLGALKGTNWQPTDMLYPIPASEILLDHNLSQNSGY